SLSAVRDRARRKESFAAAALALRCQLVGGTITCRGFSVGSMMTTAPAWSLRNRLRVILYPGLDLHTRNRASLRRYWRSGPRDVLDAGSGNGYFAWLAYKSGARVVALNVERGQVERARAFILGYRKANPDRLRFEQRNLY